MRRGGGGDEELKTTDMVFSVPSSTGQEIHLSNKYSRITPGINLVHQTGHEL